MVNVLFSFLVMLVAFLLPHSGLIPLPFGYCIPILLLIWLALKRTKENFWLVGGLYEELVFHGYIFTRLEKIITSKYSLVISFILTNIIFALYHFQLGYSGMLNAFLAGCVYHALMLRNKRNMWYAVFCHALFDTIGITFIYLGYW